MTRDWGTYRKLFELLPPGFERLPFGARAFAAEILRRCDRAGRIVPGSDLTDALVADLVFHVRAHPGEETFIRDAVKTLLTDGYLVFLGGFLTVRNFVKAQRSDSADRVAAHRANKAGVGNVTSVTGVTSCNETKRDETKSSDPPVVPPVGGRAKRRTPKIPIPDSWAPNAAHAEKAAKLGLNLDDQAQRFRNNAEGKDVRWVDWDKAFHNWLSQGAEFAQRGGKAPGLTDHEQQKRDDLIMQQARAGEWGPVAQERALAGTLDLEKLKIAIRDKRVTRRGATAPKTKNGPSPIQTALVGIAAGASK